MATWMFVQLRALKIAEAGTLATERECLACKGKLLRLAERASVHPYRWLPNGYICSDCNVCYVECG